MKSRISISAIKIVCHEGADLEPEVSLQPVKTDAEQVQIPEGNPYLDSSQVLWSSGSIPQFGKFMLLYTQIKE